MHLSLGTAQFGEDYGIANKNGQVAKKQVEGILQYAYSQGITQLDCAAAYGDSEILIAEICKKLKIDFKIVSKYSKKWRPSLTVEESVKETLSRMKIKRLYAYLMHTFDEYLKDKGLWEGFLDLKKKDLAAKTGFSLYSPHELQTLFTKNIKFDIVQFPYSIFDRRFEPYFPELKKRAIEIQVRSVFLQGLAFLNEEALPEFLNGARSALIQLKAISLRKGIPAASLCLLYPVTNQYVDQVIIGVDSQKQLEENIKALYYKDRFRSAIGELKSVEIRDEDILLPSRWKSLAEKK